MNFALKKEMSPYLEQPRAMPVGTAGKMGYLYLGFELDGEGRSILRDLERHAPLIVQQEQHITLEEGAYLEYLPNPSFRVVTPGSSPTPQSESPSRAHSSMPKSTLREEPTTQRRAFRIRIFSRCVPTPRDPTARRFSARSSSFVPTPAPPPRWERWAGTTSSPMSSY